MRRGWLGMVGLVSALTLGCLHAPVLWSPDGRWLAYTLAVQPGTRTLAPGWLFETEPAARPDIGSTRRERPVEVTGYRLWATRAETGESVLLEESRGPLTSPCWSPDGKALAFGRLVPESEGKARYEVVVQDGPGRQRVVLSRQYAAFDAKAADLPGLTPAWSPDGRYLAVPVFQQTLNLAVLRADNGRVLKMIENAYWPAWSPDRTMLAYVHGGEPETLQCLDTNFGPPRHLAEIGQTSQAPLWSHDSRSLIVVAVPGPGNAPAQAGGLSPLALARAGGRAPAPAGIASAQAKLIRVQVPTGKFEPVATLVSDAVDPDKSLYGVSFSLDHDGENLFFTTDIEDQPTQIVWFRPRHQEVLKRFHPIDYTIRIGALAIAPGGRLLALRVGAPGYLSPPALCDLTTDRLTPVVPDDSARVEWLATLIASARRILRGQLPAVSTAGVPVERATLLPIPGEIPATHEAAFRLRRIARIGRPICERPAAAPPADAALSALLDEAKLFFDYLREDYAGALKDLEALEDHPTTPDQRLRLLSLRAQVLLGLGEIDSAGQTISFLRAISPPDQRRVETTPAGSSLAAIPNPGKGWPDYLAHRASELEKGAKAPQAAREEPPGARDFVPEIMNGPAARAPFAPFHELNLPAPPIDPPILEVVPPPPEPPVGPRPLGSRR